MKVYWTAEARAQLLDIQAYVAQDSPMAARRVTATARLLRRSRKLAEPPLTGRTVPEYPASDLREVLERPFRLICRVVVERQQIDIVTVKHYRQKLPPRPEQPGG